MKNKNFTDIAINKVINCLNKISYVVNIDRSWKIAINASDNSKELLDNIINAGISNQEKADICFNAFIDKKQTEFIVQAGNLSPSYHFLAWVTKTLTDPNYEFNQKRALIENNWNKTLQQKFFNNLELTSEDLVFFHGLIHPNKIDEFYKNEKNKELKSYYEQDNAGWYNDVVKISYIQTTEIGDFKEGGKLYGYIPETFDNERFHNALNKGYADRSVGVNGVKFINKNLCELKTKGDARLYTSKLYKNTQGDFLAIFENEGNHKQVTKAAQSILEYINCDVLDHNHYSDEPQIELIAGLQPLDFEN